MLGNSDKQQWKREKKPGNDRTSNQCTETFECTISTCIEKHSNKHRKTSQQLVLCPIFRKMALKDKKAQVLSSVIFTSPLGIMLPSALPRLVVSIVGSHITVGCVANPRIKVRNLSLKTMLRNMINQMISLVPTKQML